MVDDAMAAAELLELVEDGRRPDAVGPLADLPAVVVRVDDDLAGARVAQVAQSLPCVVVGVGEPHGAAPAVDVLVTTVEDPPAPWVGPGALDPLLAAVERNPAAAVVGVQLLRAGRSLGVVPALVAESFAYGLLQAGPEHARWLAAQPPRAHVAAGRPPVRVARRADVVSVVLDRPEVRNAYDAATRDALVVALELVASDPQTTAELRGAGPSFCSGGDLREFGTVADPVTAHAIRTARSAAALLARVADRAVAHVHGACVGAGVELPAFASRVVADPGATFRLPEVAMGLVPGAGGTASVPRRIGWHRAAWLMLAGLAIDAGTALAWGLVDEVAPVSPA